MTCFPSTPVFGKGDHQEKQTKDPCPYQYRKPTVELLVSHKRPNSGRALSHGACGRLGSGRLEKMPSDVGSFFEFIYPETLLPGIKVPVFHSLLYRISYSFDLN